jgi:acetyltransferase-like isoleucine patch superfamily enzyme
MKMESFTNLKRFFQNYKSIPYYTKDHFKHRRFKSFVIGDYTYGFPNVIWRKEKAALKIGKFTSIADNVTIFLGGNHRTDWVTTYPFSAKVNNLQIMWPGAKNIDGHPATKGDVIIGNDVWIGYNAMILSGITIGDGAVIGANSVVSKNIPPYSIAIGNPVKIIKKRFDEETIEHLLKIKWWDWPKDKINSNLHSLLSTDTCSFINMNK